MTVINFNDLSRGTVVDNEYSAQGVTVSAIGGSGDAMIFDTAHPTGGDKDLKTDNLDKVLIISEDGDSSDPDDNAGGGILRFVFDEATSVESLTFLDNEEGAYVRFYDESGSLIKTEWIDPTKDNGQSVESFDVAGVYSMEVELCGSGAIDNLVFESAAADLDGTVEGTAGDDLIDVNYTGDPDGDMIDANDQILAGEGINDDLVYGYAGDDTILAGNGDDEVYGGSGDDSVDGGAGDDIIYGDRNGQPEEGAVVRESFNWEGRSDGEIDGGFSVNTGNVTVTYDRTQDTGSHESSLGDDDLNTAGIDAGGEAVDNDSSLQSITKGEGNVGEFSWGFSEPVENVSFNVNDIDGDGVVTIRAYDLNGNLIPVVLTGGDSLTLLDTDTVAGADTADSNGGYDDVDTTDYSLNVSIAGPVSRIELLHTQDGSNNSGINVTDIYFDTTDGNVGSDVDGNDVLAGGLGEDLIYGEGGDDDITGGADNDTLYGGAGDDTVQGGAGDDSIEGGAGNDLLIGDGDDGAVVGRVDELTLQWTDVATAGTGLGASQTYGVDGMNVTVEFDQQDQGATGEISSTDMYVESGENFDPNSGLYLYGLGGEGGIDNTSTTTLTFTSADAAYGDDVQDVSFRINDIDNGSDADDHIDIVTVRAYDADGNEVPVTITAESAAQIIDGNTVTGGVEHSAGVTPASQLGSVLYNIAGPVARIEIDYDNGEDTDQRVDVTDINFFTTPAETVDAEAGDDMISGGDGVDEIYGNAGDDTLSGDAGDDVVYGGADRDVIIGGAGDTVDGGAAGDDYDILDVTGQGEFILTGPGGVGDPIPDSNGNGFDGRLVFLDSDGDPSDQYIDFVEIEEIRGEQANAGPIASDDDFTGTEDDPAAVLGNVITGDNGNGVDSDPDGDPLTVSEVNGNPAGVGTPVAGDNGGLVTIDEDGTVSFDPNGEFEALGDGESDTTTVTYTVTDPDGLASTATVTFTVTGSNDGPVAVADVGTATQDDVLDLGNVVTANDTDPEDDILTVSEVNGVAANVGTAVAGDNGGLITINGDGTASFDPNGEFDALANGATTTTQVSYTITDPDGETSSTTVTITVTGTNDGPVAVADAFGAGEDDPAAVLGNVITGDNGNGVDSDPDGDPLTVSEVNGNPAGVGTPVAGDNGGLVTIDEDGTVSFDPNGEFEALGDGESDTTTVTYTVTDPDGLASTATVTFTVTGSNDGPVAVADLGTTDEDTVVVLDNVLGNDIDPDDTDLTVSAVNGADANVGAPTDGDGGGSFTIGEDGTASFDPTGDFDYLAPGETAESAITYTVTDPDGETSTTTVTVTVTGVNDGPVAVDNSYVATSTEAAGDIDGNVITDNTGAGVDSDPEGDMLTVSAVAGDAGNVGAAVAGDNGGLFTINADGTVDFDANGDFADLGLGATADTSVTYTIIDENGAEDTATATFTVSGINDGTVQGTAGDDIINPDIPYVDADGDIVDANDGILPGAEGTDDDLILGFGGNDSIDAGEGNDVVFGGTGNDTIEGGAGNDQLMGNDGDDVVSGGDGDDMIFGAAGDDSLAGNAGNDKIEGSEGDDTIRGGDGEDDLWGGLDDDTVFGGDDNDTVAGGAGNDTLDGGTGDDLVLGEDGDDSIQGGTGDDSIDGGTGNDNINAGQGNDVVAGGDGNDVINAGNNIDPALDYDYPSIPFGDNDPFPNNDLDTVFGGAGDDVITTGDDNDSIDGGAGNDYIDAGIDDDSVTGGTGNDTIIGGQGEDIIEGNEGDDLIYGGLVTEVLDLPDAIDEAPDDNRDTIYGGAGNDTIFGRDDADTLYGGTGNDVLDGGIDDDVIFGDDGDDTIYGGQGNDVINGGTGVDLIYGGLGDDTIQGNQDDDAIYGDEGNDTITGSLDDDLVFGGADDDEIRGGTGDDTLHGDAGNDYIQGGYGDDSLYGGDGDDSLNGGFGNDIVEGGDGNDTIAGFDGEDVLTGGAGEDTLYGGQNSDLFLGGNGGDNVVGGEDPDDSDVDVLDLTGSNVDFITYTDGDPESGVVTFLDGTTMTFSEIENVIPCFTPGTTIATAKGERLVEELTVGDRIITRDNGIQEIAWVGHKAMTGKQLVQNPHLKPILIKAGALGNGLPERDMMVSPNHRVLVASDLTQLYFEENEVLAAAKHMVGTQGIHAIDVMSTTYVHFMFERHEVVLSNGAWTESFQPGDYSLKGIGNSQRNEIMELFPDLATKSGLEGYQSARKALKKHEAKLLIK